MKLEAAAFREAAEGEVITRRKKRRTRGRRVPARRACGLVYRLFPRNKKRVVYVYNVRLFGIQHLLFADTRYYARLDIY